LESESKTVAMSARVTKDRESSLEDMAAFSSSLANYFKSCWTIGHYAGRFDLNGDVLELKNYLGCRNNDNHVFGMTTLRVWWPLVKQSFAVS
jgi:hypothetical protein